MTTFGSLSEIACLSTAAAALGWGAASDVVSYTIPNRVPLLVAGSWVATVLAAPALPGLGGLATGLGVLGFGALLFARNWMGGGDVKLLAAVALWAGPTLVAPFILVTCLGGGVLALLLMTPLRRMLPAAPVGAAGRSGGTGLLHQPMPFGVAIAAGGAYVLLLQPLY